MNNLIVKNEFFNAYSLEAENIVYANNASSRGHIHGALSYKDFAICDRVLTRTGVRPMTYSSERKSPIYPSWIAVGHTDLKFDLCETEDFVPAWKGEYDKLGLCSEFEFGYIGKNWPIPIRILLSSELKAIESSGDTTPLYLSSGGIPDRSLRCDVYPIVIFGQELDLSKIVRYEVGVTALYSVIQRYTAL